jgi:hypothetical protein
VCVCVCVCDTTLYATATPTADASTGKNPHKQTTFEKEYVSKDAAHV